MTYIAAFIVAAILVLVVRKSARREPNTVPPTEAERLALWDIRRGQYLAAERLRHARMAQAFDERAGVYPVLDPRRLP